MKTLTTIIVIFGLAFFLRVNLPPDEIASNIELKEDIGLFEEYAAKMVASQTVANWERMDLIVVKLACSERLKTTLIAIPFQKWSVLERDIEKCWDFSNMIEKLDAEKKNE